MSTESSTPLTIRVLSVDDLEAFRRIRLEALREEPEAFTSTVAGWQALPDVEWRRRLTETSVFAAFLGEEVVGIMGLKRETGTKKAHRATVNMVYMRKALRGRGASTELLHALMAHARREGIRSLELSLNGENVAAHNFYLREGFVDVGRIPGGLLQDGREIDEILMVRRLGF